MQRMRTFLICSLVLLCSGCAHVDDRNRPVGQNCDLATPPKSAGEDAHHGVLLLVYPRAREIGTNYNGCQVAWIQHENEATLAWIVVIQQGEVVRVWSQDPQMEAMLGQCVWENGIIKKGTSGACGDSKSMIMKSFLPGCISKAPTSFTEAELKAYDTNYCGKAE